MKKRTQIFKTTSNQGFTNLAPCFVLVCLVLLSNSLFADSTLIPETALQDVPEETRKVRIIPFAVLGLIVAFFVAKWVNQKSSHKK